MEYEKIHKLVNGGKTMPDLMSKFTSKKLVDDLHNEYNENKEIRFKTSMLRSDLCDYSDAYVEVTENVIVTANKENEDNIRAYNNDRTFTLKNNAPFISCITKINGELIENAEDLDVVMSM